MKIIGIILSGIMFILIVLTLSSIIWMHPFSSASSIIQIAAGVNYFVAGAVAVYITESFSKWFKSNLK